MKANKVMSVNSSFQSTKYQKKKHSVFRQHAHRPQLKNLLASLSSSYEAHQSKIVAQVLQNRQSKLSEIRKLKSKPIWLKPFQPVHQTQRFSEEKPISLGDKYLLQKFRINIIVPQRAFNNQPNMKAGSPDKSKMIQYTNNQDPRIINQKFQEYVRIVNQQSGAVKRKRFSEITNDNNHSLPVIKSPYKMSMKKTYFKKYPSDQFNFYRPPIKQISRIQKIFQLTSQRQSTQRSRQLNNSRQNSPSNYQTLQTGISRVNSIKKYQSTAAKTLDAYRQM